MDDIAVKSVTSSLHGLTLHSFSSEKQQANISKPTAEMASNKPAPAPETLDAKYIAEVLGQPLTAALAEVAEKRPWDPIEFLAQWLYKHKSNLDHHQAVSTSATTVV